MGMNKSPSLVWFRLDLRLDDHPALLHAFERKHPVIPVYIWSPEEEGEWSPGTASRWWLHQSLERLDAELRKIGAHLILRRGLSLEVLNDLIRETGADGVFWNRRYEPALVARDAEIKAELRSRNIIVESFNASLLHEPWEVLKSDGKPYQVFTAFWKALLSLPEPSLPLAAPTRILAPDVWPDSLPLPDLGLVNQEDWTENLREIWSPGSEGAMSRLERFIDEFLWTYTEDRDRPDREGTSRLSPHLHFGEISPRYVWHAAREHAENHRKKGKPEGVWSFLRELAWREFAYQLLFHFPYTPDQPLKPEFMDFPWKKNTAAALEAWQQGRTGYPLVDAGMRELRATGWMHNRARMITASFLVKDLLISWVEGAKWFWDTLVDADLANNTFGWQWTAGCGADAAPYYRIFNPVLQGEKFDPNGEYVRRWLPELAALPNHAIHQPWTASALSSADDAIEHGKSYPPPMVDHLEARQNALFALSTIKKIEENTADDS